MDELKNFLSGLLVPTFMALFGGLASYCYHGNRGLWPLVRGLVVSGFAGIVVHLLIVDSSLSSTTQAAVTGTSGFGGAIVINGLVAWLLRWLEKRSGL